MKEKKFYFGKEYIIIFFVILMNSVVGAFSGKCILNLEIDNLHQGVLFGLTVITVMGVNWCNYLKKNDILMILKVIFFLGVSASIYAMVFQRESLIGIILKRNSAMDAWIYRSFFDSRNVFAYFCFLSSVAGMYLFYLTKKKKYLLGMFFLALQIYATDSRTAMLILFLFYALCVFFSLRKHEKFFFLIICACLFICMFLFIDISVLVGRFYHESNTSFGDSGLLRLNMWRSGIGCLISKRAVIFGFGFGSQVPYLVPKFDLGSFHNAYMDVFFQGGFILLGVYLYMIVKVFRSIFMIKNKGYKNISTSFIIVFLLGCLFDSSAMLFSSNYEAVLSTLMVCTLTQVKMEVENI